MYLLIVVGILELNIFSGVEVVGILKNWSLTSAEVVKILTTMATL
jgi:hypothetical protein